MKTKNRLLYHISEITLLQPQNCHATTISDALNLDRANVSRHLNSLHRMGALVKVKGRPTLFLCRQTLEKTHHQAFPAQIPNLSYLSNSTPDAFMDFFDLPEQVELAKAALHYPLHAQLLGHDQMVFAHAMKAYAIAHGILPSDAQSIVLNCKNLRLDCLLDSANESKFIILMDAHALSDEIIAVLRNEASLKGCIVAISHQASLSCFPITITLPKLNHRSFTAVQTLVQSAFLNEVRLKKISLTVSGQVIASLMSHCQSMTQLTDLVKQACALAVFRNEHRIDQIANLTPVATWATDDFTFTPTTHIKKPTPNPESNFNEGLYQTLANSLSFLDPRKALVSLHSVLDEIRIALRIDCPLELRVQFITEAAYMLERCIMKEPHHQRTAGGQIATQPHLFITLKTAFKALESRFAIDIPDDELAQFIPLFKQ